ncbi:hypothetical protein [Chryseobacterium sp. AG363]|uniref:hypothetical protein n=1 Tax=Chryseobacterium sp. AG363 TaxID=2183997 RepID=UPI000E7185F1|nr:hypothetical protein [Chryseobacterium sp. AG363]RKE77874.1 hypothetical protein DEU39_3507 [Chryseobacterium sp. AG363]
MDGEVTYSLATIDSPNITNIRILSYHDYESISQIINKLEKFQHDEALYSIIELNLNDLNQRCKFYLEKYAENPKLDSKEFSLQFLDLNRIILNTLSSIRTYLDHTETRLKRNFGNESEEFLLFKRLTSECFDNYFSYRFLSKLRNYAQHCGLPTGSINLTDDVNGYKLELSLLRDDLLGSFDSWGLNVKPDLQNQDSQFDILPLLEEKTELLRDVNTKMNSLILQKLKYQGENLLKLIEETQIKGKGIPCLLRVFGDVDSPTMQIKWFPYEVITKITGVKINMIYHKE